MGRRPRLPHSPEALLRKTSSVAPEIWPCGLACLHAPLSTRRIRRAVSKTGDIRPSRSGKAVRSFADQQPRTLM